MLKRILSLISLLMIVIPEISMSEGRTTPLEKREDGHTKCNHLKDEKSPYLLQHKDNPVCWYPWGKQAFQAAKEQNKPIFLSIGYSTCYWCHMMEKDSFENEDVAALLNKHFISIKVDREERPDVDALYMDAVIGLTGSGGWPMSVFLTPELTPFWGGTFFPRINFIQILNQINNGWSEKNSEVIASAKSISKSLNQSYQFTSQSKVNEQALRNFYKSLKHTFDEDFGGFGSAPKFPPDMQVSLLLRLYRRSGSREALSMARETLIHMARGGIYDHLGGGFHRYSTDSKWLVPHFEKMLYTNAQLAFTFLEGSQVTGEEIFSEVARETLDYVLREMTSPDGGFYSAQDAGEVGKEGDFYVWTKEQLKSVLTLTELKRLIELYGITDKGNFENGTNILTLQSPFDWSAKKDPAVTQILKKLLSARNRRHQPYRDDKVLTGWNGLMISAFAKGFQVLGDDRYLKAAEKCVSFIRRKLYTPNGLLRRYRDGVSGIDGFLEDYAYLIEGLLHLYESTYNKEFLVFARELQDFQDRKFWDSRDGGYYLSTAPELIARKKDFTDNAMPSGNSTALLNLLRLYGFYAKRSYLKKAEDLLTAASGQIAKYPTAFPRMLQALDYRLDRSKEVVILFPSYDKQNKDELRNFFGKTFLPNQVVLSGVEGESLPLFQHKALIDGKTTYYVCEEGSCKFPTNDLSQAKKLIERYLELRID